MPAAASTTVGSEQLTSGEHGFVEQPKDTSGGRGGSGGSGGGEGDRKGAGGVPTAPRNALGGGGGGLGDSGGFGGGGLGLGGGGGGRGGGGPGGLGRGGLGGEKMMADTTAPVRPAEASEAAMGPLKPSAAMRAFWVGAAGCPAGTGALAVTSAVTCGWAMDLGTPLPIPAAASCCASGLPLLAAAVASEATAAATTEEPVPTSWIWKGMPAAATGAAAGGAGAAPPLPPVLLPLAETRPWKDWPIATEPAATPAVAPSPDCTAAVAAGVTAVSGAPFRKSVPTRRILLTDPEAPGTPQPPMAATSCAGL